MTSTPPETRSRRLVDAVAREVSEFTLKPGERLTESELARKYSVSRTPVREALKTLHEMGLVDRLPGGGYAVRVIKLEDIADLMVVWVTLEDLALDLANRHADKASFERMLARERHTACGNPMVAEEFHSEIARLSGNAELARMLQTIYIRTQPYRRLDGMVRAQQVDDDHARILELLIDGRADAAREMMRGHIEATHRFIGMLMQGGVQALSFDPAT